MFNLFRYSLTKQCWLQLLILFCCVTLVHPIRCWVCGSSQSNTGVKNKGMDVNEDTRYQNNRQNQRRVKDRRGNTSKMQRLQSFFQQLNVAPVQDQSKKDWCGQGSGVTNITCPGNGMVCYKETWDLDGQMKVRRGCIEGNANINGRKSDGEGCEEILRDSKETYFQQIICMCPTDLCNDAVSWSLKRFLSPKKTAIYLVFILVSFVL